MSELKCQFLNARSNKTINKSRNDLFELKSIMEIEKPFILGINETCLDESV